PHSGRRAHVGSGMPLLGVNEVRKLQRIAHEENRRIVADQVPVAFFGIEAQREAAYVALGLGGAALARHRRKAQESFGRFALLQHLGLGVFRDVVRDGQGAIGARTLGVLAAFGNALAVLVGKLALARTRAWQKCSPRLGNCFGSIAAIVPVLPQSLRMRSPLSFAAGPSVMTFCVTRECWKIRS